MNQDIDRAGGPNNTEQVSEGGRFEARGAVANMQTRKKRLQQEREGKGRLEERMEPRSPAKTAITLVGEKRARRQRKRQGIWKRIQVTSWKRPMRGLVSMRKRSR